MRVSKAAFVALLILAGTAWSIEAGGMPVPALVEDTVTGIVGVVGLALGSVFRAIGPVLQPVAVLLRVAAVPLVLAGLAYLIVRELRRPTA